MITNIGVRQALTGEDRDHLGRLPIVGRAHGALWAHFNTLRGLNALKDCTCTVVIGRPMPSPRNVERTAHAFFAEEANQLCCLEADENGQVRFARALRGYVLRSGQNLGVEVDLHPDPNVELLLELICDRELAQVIDRLRLVHHDGVPKQVFILCNRPLPITIDHLIVWGHRTPQLIRAAIELQAGGSPVMPLGATWLARRFSHIWRTEKAAERCVEEADEVLPPVRNMEIFYASRGLFRCPVGEVRYRLDGQRGRHPARAWVFAELTAEELGLALKEAHCRPVHKIIISGFSGS